MNKKLYKSILSAMAAAVLTVNAIPMSAMADTPANDRIVYSFLTERLGLHHGSASGLMSNIYKESAFQPTASCIDTNGRISYGLMQWNGPRFERLKSFCESNGYGYDTLEGQLAYLEYDLTGAYSGYYDHLLYGIEDSQQGAYDAAYFWAAQYEVCNSRYFEVRAELARDFYYTEFMEYAPIDAVIFEDDFYCTLTNAASGMSLSIKDTSLLLDTTEDSNKNVWHFTRYGTDTYTAVSCYNNKPLKLNGNEVFSFLETPYGYMLKAENTDEVLGYSENAGLQMQVRGGSEMQSFIINSKTLPSAPKNIEAAYSPAPSITTFTWTKTENTDSYRVMIYDNAEAYGTPVIVKEGLTENTFKYNLPAGTYSAVAESKNECGYASSEPVVFTIEQQKAVDLGESFTAKISWSDGLQYLTSTDSSEVNYKAKTYEEEQVWSFTRNSDGSYKINPFGSEKVLTENNGEASLQENTAENKSWMIYGNEQQGYILQQKGESYSVISVGEGNIAETRNYSEASGQQFAIDEYSFENPILHANAEGGVKEAALFTWEKADCAEGYILIVKDHEGCTAASVKIRDNLSEAEIALKEGSYTAEISAVSSVTGETVRSDIASFEIKNLPQRPEPELILNKAPGMVSFRWERCPDADSYSYRITDKATGKTVKYKPNVKGMNDSVQLTAGAYVLTVTAVNKEGTITSHEFPLVLDSEEDGSAMVSMRSILASRKHENK